MKSTRRSINRHSLEKGNPGLGASRFDDWTRSIFRWAGPKVPLMPPVGAVLSQPDRPARLMRLQRQRGESPPYCFGGSVRGPWRRAAQGRGDTRRPRGCRAKVGSRINVSRKGAPQFAARFLDIFIGEVERVTGPKALETFQRSSVSRLVEQLVRVFTDLGLLLGRQSADTLEDFFFDYHHSNILPEKRRKKKVTF